ncbi:YciI family protein [Allorhizocola rhizosphaerae]|uniref:YciI family protein n=1 Tax=Allorhizocola rhizosphaerae TaxID=1872709 RepID=UPI000E3DD244|nr:YciI family protein [Allorhizocola rhizosphaerae]
MKYMLLMNYARPEDLPPVHTWTPEEIRASGEHMMGIHRELSEAGELVGTEGLTAPDAAKIVTSDGGVPVVTDGPFPETKEFLAGYWLIDVESEERAIEIAARTSAAPGPGGKPTGRPVEVRPVMSRGASEST